ncbi:non-ribosomal peptide synthetase [Horticoccus sp. 23ND18S-11]|uniref:non-ribosomal peptide synthetase n=1 Tax=Horticoccus sp. 23ND18S-11 TaxID=3391832 RepID=UPI0039C9E36B
MSGPVAPDSVRSAQRSVELHLLHSFFERAADRTPEHPAIDVPPGPDRPVRRVITYDALRQQANVLAHALHPLVTGEGMVAVLLPRTSELLFGAQLAILQAGAAFACIDPSFPDEQVREILADSRPVAVITSAAGARRLDALRPSGTSILIAETILDSHPRATPALAAPAWLAPHSLAYVIYTSGTTGRPKGVMIEHRSIANLVGSDLAEFKLTPRDRVAQGSSAAYDSSIEETWLALAAGATLVVMDDDAARLGPDLVAWLRRERITVLCPPPTLLRTTGCNDPATALPDLRLLYVGGEALPPDVAKRWAPGRRLENGYGPTECTVTSLRTPITADGEISIGRPVPGLDAWVLNDALEPVPIGEAGELCLGGVGLARGYHGRPDLTAEKFPQHARLGRIYRTGDLVEQTPSGHFLYRGRIDAQVKLRGYRVELEAIEARLTEIPGVREAACHVQGEGARQLLTAFVVPEHPHSPPALDQLALVLRKVLPVYMVPARFGLLDQLPRTVGGKINRRALPVLADDTPAAARPVVAPRNALERTLASVFAKVFEASTAISIHDDFFRDLGGDSLSAAVVTSLLREDPATASLTVRDLYEARTIAELAQRASDGAVAAPAPPEAARTQAGKPALATLLQTLWLAKGVVVGSVTAYVGAFLILPQVTPIVGVLPLVFFAPVVAALGLALYVPLSLLAAVRLKRLLIGRYVPLRAPVWGSFYVRNWIVQQAVKSVPWWVIEGTEFQCTALRALGATIGQRVHLHRGVDLLQGGWDLLEIGDDVTISQDATIRLVELEDGAIIVGRITLGAGSTLDIHAGVGANTHVGPRAYLTAWSSLSRGGRIPAGERWDGIPAHAAGAAPDAPEIRKGERILSPRAAGVRMLTGRFALLLVLAAPAELLAVALAAGAGIGSEQVTRWLLSPTFTLPIALAAIAFAALVTPLTVVMQAVACRLMGRVSAGVMSRWSPDYVRVWLKTGLVDAGGRWLYGTLFWPTWLRVAGMKVGRGCEISGLIDTVPEMVEIGAGTFCADGIYLAGPRVHRGTVAIAAVKLGENTFLGNGVVIAGGQQLSDNILIGVCTIADETSIRSGTAWFGHPPFELPQRQVIACDHRLTHAPSSLRYLNRVFWELLRFALPVAPALVLPLWFVALNATAGVVPLPLFILGVVPAISVGAIASLVALAVAIKWSLLGRVQKGTHALWSCWASRWDFVCMAWSYYAPGVTAALGGTLLLSPLLRAMGVRVGRRVILGGGFAQDLPDPDMLTIEDGATVDCMFQAHTFEDRVLKIDQVIIRREASVGRNAVLLYGAEVGARTRVAAHSVVMKHERLLPGRHYAGFPTRPQPMETGANGS